MQTEYWQGRWKTNDIPFHLSKAHPLLTKYFSSLPKGKVLVPLCGKSLDMKWLLDQGHEVIGVELSPIACEAFFTENQLNFTIEEKSTFTIYKGKHISIWCGDILQLPAEACHNLTAIYDRAALFALPEEIRNAYVKQIKMLIQAIPNIVMLLITVEYDQNLLNGPPFSLTENDIRQLYADTFQIKKMPADPSSAFQGLDKFKNIAIQDYTYWLNKI